MTAKEYMRQYYDLTKEVEMLDREIADLTAEIESTNERLDGMPKGGQIADKTGSLAVKLADKTSELMDMRTAAWNKRLEIVNMIHSIQRMPYARVLYLRYIQMQCFEQIAVDMGYGYRHVTRLHGQALQKVDEILQQEEKTCPIMSDTDGVL